MICIFLQDIPPVKDFFSSMSRKLWGGGCLLDQLKLEHFVQISLISDGGNADRIVKQQMETQPAENCFHIEIITSWLHIGKISSRQTKIPIAFVFHCLIFITFALHSRNVLPIFPCHEQQGSHCCFVPAD